MLVGGKPISQRRGSAIVTTVPQAGARQHASITAVSRRCRGGVAAVSRRHQSSIGVIRGQQVRGEQQWPDAIWIVRHGESAGNVAREAAETAEIPMIDLATRDADVPLSSLGMEQAAAWGVCLHASAGDRLEAKRGSLGYLARELLE